MGHRNLLISSVALLCLLLLASVGCSKAEELAPALVLERAYAATQEVTSYHFTMSVAVAAEGMGEFHVSNGEGDYVAPDRVRMKSTEGVELSEQINIGRKMYIKPSESSAWFVQEFPKDEPTFATGFGNMVDPKRNLEFMQSPGENVTQLDDEVIDDVESWRYRLPTTSTDPLKNLMEDIEKEADPQRKEMLGALIEVMRKMGERTRTTEIWIGKEDYLVRQFSTATSQNAVGSEEFGNITIPEGTRYTVTMTFKLFGFNEPVEIEAPI